MATHSVAAKNAQAKAVGDLLNGGQIRFKNTGGTVLATMNFAAQAFAAPANGAVAIPAAITGQVVADGGTIATYECYSSANALIISGTVTVAAGNGEVKLQRLDYVGGETISLNSFIYRVPDPAV